VALVENFAGRARDAALMWSSKLLGWDLMSGTTERRHNGTLER